MIDAGYHEKRLLHHLLDNYNVLERPVVNESDPLQLSFGLTLMQIIDVVSRRRAPNKLALATDLIRKATETDESEKKKAARKSEKFCDAISTEANDLLMQGSWSRLPPPPSITCHAHDYPLHVELTVALAIIVFFSHSHIENRDRNKRKS